MYCTVEYNTSETGMGIVNIWKFQDVLSLENTGILFSDTSNCYVSKFMEKSVKSFLKQVIDKNAGF